MPAKLRFTPDEGLLTEAAIRFRIQLLQNNSPTPALLRRVEALKARLPKTEGEALKPAIDPALLVSSNCLEWGDKMPYAK